MQSPTQSCTIYRHRLNFAAQNFCRATLLHYLSKSIQQDWLDLLHKNKLTHLFHTHTHWYACVIIKMLKWSTHRWKCINIFFLSYFFFDMIREKKYLLCEASWNDFITFLLYILLLLYLLLLFFYYCNHHGFGYKEILLHICLFVSLYESKSKKGKKSYWSIS